MSHSPMTRTLRTAAAFAILTVVCGAPAAYSATPAELLGQYTRQAGKPPVAARGQQFFTNKHGHDWSCASCHGAVPTQAGRHAATGKSIAPLAPALNAERFTDPKKVEKWFRRNCNDVVGRECTADEKADVLSWLATLE
jgi:uncharacterized protein DUF1924